MTPPAPSDSSARLPAQGPQDLTILVTAAETYPEMERAFLAARREIWAGYRVFDLSTRLRSPEARAIGTLWFDLILHTLRRGVDLTFVLSDFDPILAGDLHRASWRARRAFAAVREVLGPAAAGRLTVINAIHSARVGLLPRLALWPWLVRETARQAAALNDGPAAACAARLDSSPGLRTRLRRDAAGRLVARRWPPPPLVPGTHHQKMAVIDRETLFIGGLDLDERRYDDNGHRRRSDETWQDVQLKCRGPVVADAQRHLESFLGAVDARRPAAPSGRLLRTLSRRRRVLQAPFLGPRPVLCELAEAHYRLAARARHLIYLETQFFRDRRLADTLADAALRRPELGLILVLPGAPEDVAFDAATGADARFGEYLQVRCVDTVLQGFGARAAICSPVQPVRAMNTAGRDTLHGSPIIYVHTKVSIFDDDRAIVSSANLNGRSFYWDTEVGLELERADHVEALRHRVCGHWLPGDEASAFLALEGAAHRWLNLARANARVRPHERRGVLVPYDVEPARAFGRRLRLVPDAVV